MSHILQNYLADAAQKAAVDLETALLRLPAEKRDWVPMGQARSAADMVAECALLNKNTAQTIEDRAFPVDFDFAGYTRKKAELLAHPEDLLPLLHENTAHAVAIIRAVPDEALGTLVEMPWGPMTLTQLISYPYWNMSYHEGQINYIASLIGCLK